MNESVARFLIAEVCEMMVDGQKLAVSWQAIEDSMCEPNII